MLCIRDLVRRSKGRAFTESKEIFTVEKAPVVATARESPLYSPYVITPDLTWPVLRGALKMLPFQMPLFRVRGSPTSSWFVPPSHRNSFSLYALTDTSCHSNDD
jgi:hypothetical protein